MLITVLIAFIAVIISAIFGVLFFDEKRRLHELNELYENQMKFNEKAKAIQENRESIIFSAMEKEKQLIGSAIQQVEKIEHKKQELEGIVEKLEVGIDALEKNLSPLREEFELVAVSFYKPHYNFKKNIDFERAIIENRNEQKKLISDGAVITDDMCDKKLSTVLKKLLLRSFNMECDYYMMCVDYKNIVVYENRIQNVFDQLNKLTLPYSVYITEEFKSKKIQELRLVHEQQEKKQAELEEQARIKEIMRDELKAEREMEKAKEAAEREEANYNRLLERAIEQAQNAHGVELEKYNMQINLLKQQLEEAKEKERKISMAQQTKAGHVYVISNIGSFGENVFKIGMTRRLVPQERIDELGDASVPFPFDVHAMISCENAPEIEQKLHQKFDHVRLNKINMRKEFFKINLSEIESIAREIKADVSFLKYPEAKEYRQSLAAIVP